MKWPLGALARVLHKEVAWRHPSIVIWLALASTVGGAGVGYCLGRFILKQRTEMIADQFVLRIQSTVQASGSEEAKVIDGLKRSPYRICSDEDVAWMRMELYHSDYLSEIGRMRDGQVVCSATQGRIHSGDFKYKPDLITRRGDKIFLNPRPYQRANLTIVGRQTGDAFLVARPTAQIFFGTAPLHFAITTFNERGQIQYPIVGPLQGAPAWILTQDIKTTWNGSVYATRCGPNHGYCTTAGMPLTAAMTLAHSGVTLTTGFGALLGAMLSLISLLQRSRGQVLEWQLRKAIREDRLQAYYMPIVNLRSREVVGAEALVRWSDDAGRPVSPDVFVRLAEERGFIGEITQLMVEHVMREFGDYLRSHPEFRISLNATATDFASMELPLMLQRNLEKAGLAPRSLVVEITESSTARQEAVRDTIHRLRQLGISVHIDDFGTGYSSLAYLHELSVDAIKIDRSFTKAIGTEAVTVTILPQIMAMADSLDLGVIVEGIETEEQASYFSTLAKTRFAQGWLYGSPVPASRFDELYLSPKSHAQTPHTFALSSSIVSESAEL